jgi:germination protein YpeB
MDNLHNLATNLENTLVGLEQDIQTGRLKWGELQSAGPVAFKRASKNLSDGKIGDMEKQFKEYPSLIYDGPFSEHIERMEPLVLSGKPDIDVNKAFDVAKKFVGPEKVTQISNPTNGEGTIKTYSILINGPTTPNNSAITVDVTRKGGYVLYMLNSRPVGATSLNIQQAKDIANKFLVSKGYTGMKDTYYMVDNNTATINFAYVQNSVVMYPDLMKVKVALDNGEVIGFESRGYLMSHKTRNLPIPKITEKQARKMLNPRLDIKSVGLAVIPLESKREVFVYEIKGNVANRNFLTYINAETGKEENILVIIDTPNGILTM